MGGLLGAAGHFANTLPDLDDDATTGVRGLPHRPRPPVVERPDLRRSARGIRARVLRNRRPRLLPADLGLAISIVIAAVGAAMILRPTRWHFRLIILAAMVDVVVLIFAGTRILA
ncbi:MAG: hypothetical protein WDM88_13540 [Galbitalea sp.]